MALRDRLQAKVDRRGPGECWPWLGATAGNGYGYLRDDEGRVQPVARLVLILGGRDPGPGGKARHSCDNPICCNPAHLEPGSHQDNMDDMKRRGRSGKKLTRAQVVRIKRRIARGRDSHRVIAEAFGVTKQSIWKIADGRVWAHVEAA